MSSGPALSVSVNQVLDQLRSVVDPCSIAMAAPVDVVDMGLVEDVVVDGASVTVRLVLTDASCGFYRDLRRHVIDAVSVLPDIDSVEVELDATVMWTPDRMSAAR